MGDTGSFVGGRQTFAAGHCIVAAPCDRSHAGAGGWLSLDTLELSVYASALDRQAIGDRWVVDKL